MEKLGTEYGGWHVPIDIGLDENSIVYSGGVGEDMSFDILLQDKYGCHMWLIDPTVKAQVHFEECRYFFLNEAKFSGNIQPDYYKQIRDTFPNFDKIHYINLGLWNVTCSLPFYKQTNESYVSQSLIPNMFGDNHYMVDVDTIKNIMDHNGHDHIDLLKLDIEGAEINVLNQMLCDGILPRYILVEYDLLLKNKDSGGSTNLLNRRILSLGYRILCNVGLNVTYQLAARI